MKDLAPLWINKLFFLMLALAKPQGRQIFVLFFVRRTHLFYWKLIVRLHAYVLCIYIFIMNNLKVVKFLVCTFELLKTWIHWQYWHNLIYFILIRYVRNSFIPEKFKLNLTRWKSGLVSNTKSNNYCNNLGL